MEIRWRSEEWVVHVVGDVRSEAPVIPAIFEQIKHGHRPVREPMNELGFEEAF